MSERALEEAGRLLSRRVGLRLDPAVRGRLARAVRTEAERLGQDEADYVAGLEADPERMQHLLNQVTVQETSFFRDPGQFAALATHVLPPLERAGGRVQIWSAGCSNGQEPYSLAMTLAESGIRDWHVLASDLSTNALGRTSAARYRERELRGLSAERREKYLERVDGTDEWRIIPALTDRVTTIRHNLAADPPPFVVGACQVVFCRNVLIYFGRDDVVAFLHRLASHLTSSGILFLGYSESLWQVTERFQLVRLGDAFVYRPASPTSRREEPAPPRPPARPEPAPTPAPPPLWRAQRPTTGTPLSNAEAEPAPVAVSTAAGVVELLAEGEAALGRGDHAAAVTAFRKAAFVDPDHPLTHLNLGLALEVVGDHRSALRAYAAARAAIERGDTAAVESTLEGYHLDDLVRLLDRKAGSA